MWNEFYKGFFEQNPVYRILLGMCATLAVTTSVINGIGMGIATSFVLVFSNVFISLLRKITPNNIRIPVFVIVIATFTTIIDLLMAAYAPALSKALGVFVPLIVVNCIIFGRAEAFACKAPVLNALLDGLGMGVGFTIALVTISVIREVLGHGMLIMIMPPGAFLALGLIIGFINLRSKAKA